jgi:hypothetical protein
MPSTNQVLALYQELANWYEQKGQAQMRDRFLVLAADAALSAGKADQAERLRLRLLQQNPHHLLKPYTSMAEALKAPDVQSYVGDLRRSYSPETAENLLQSLRANAATAAARGSPNPPPAPEARAPEPPKESPEVLKFYRVHEEPDEVVPEPVAQRQIPTTRPVPKPSAPKPAAPPPPSARKSVPDAPPAGRAPAKKPVRPAPVSPWGQDAPSSPPADGEELATGYWVPTLLFVVLLLGGLALAVYTFARPFLPAEWFN